MALICKKKNNTLCFTGGGADGVVDVVQLHAGPVRAHQQLEPSVGVPDRQAGRHVAVLARHAEAVAPSQRARAHSAQ